MGLAASDISWPMLRQIVRDWAGADAELDEVKLLDGGSIATTVVLHLRSGERAVLKLTQHRVDRAYADEAHQLKLLRDIGVPTPAVYRSDTGSLDNPFSYLLMEFKEGIDLARARAQCTPDEFAAVQGHLAAIVQVIHAQTHEHFHRVCCDGSSKRFEGWAQLFREAYDPIWAEAERVGHLPSKARKQVARLHERLPQLLAHADRPRLLHGDLWSSNILVKKDQIDGEWRVTAILDPACRYGDVECELAYLELFHTVNGNFLRSYLGDKHLATDYHRVRKPIYHLYELLNHLQLFGPEYLKPTLAAVERVSHLV
jgi:fructosamine-3-kinase